MKKERGIRSIIFLPKNSRGQFYLITSMILATLIIGIVAVANYASTKPAPKIYNLKTELSIELEKVLEYKVYSGDDKRAEFAGNFSEYAGSTVKVYFIFSNTNGIEAYYFDGGVKKDITNVVKNGNQISLTVDNLEYNFQDTAKENAHFIIVENINNENYVATS